MNFWYDRRGSASAYVILVMALFGITLAALQFRFNRATQDETRSHAEYEARLLADSAQEEARALLQNRDYDRDMPSWNRTIPGVGSYMVTIDRPSSDERRVVSTAVAMGHTYTLTRSYTFAPAQRTAAQVFADTDINILLGSRIEGSIRSNGDISLGLINLQGPLFGPQSEHTSIVAAGEIYAGIFDCEHCQEHASKLDVPMPDEAVVRQGATEIVLTAANTTDHEFHIGGDSCEGWGWWVECYPGLAQDTTVGHPFVFGSPNQAYYIRSGDGQEYTVRIDSFAYRGTGTFIMASQHIHTQFDDSTWIRRGHSSRESCVAILPMQTAAVGLPLNFRFEGVLVAPALDVSGADWRTSITGAMITQKLDGSFTTMGVYYDADLLTHVPSQIPFGIDTQVTSDGS